MKLAKKHKIKVIEDNAQDLLGKYKNRLSGFTGDIGVWSFENKKHLSGATEGGMIATNNKVYAERLRKFSGIGYKNMTATGGRTSLSIEKVQAATPSGDSALSDWFDRAAKDTAAASVVATWRPPSTEDVSVVF